MNLAQWLMPINLATREAEIRRIMFKTSLGESLFKTSLGEEFTIPYKNTQHIKGLAEWLKWYRAFLASMRPQVQTLIPLKIKEYVCRPKPAPYPKNVN
jgi:hypothetical protein